MPFIIGHKLDMTQRFLTDGTVVPVTLVAAAPNMVTQTRTLEKDGYAAVQVGTDVKKTLNKPAAGHLQDLPNFSVLREFRSTDAGLKRGDPVDLSAFTPGMSVDVTGLSKGRGFAGVMKRHHFSGGPATHGQKDQMRMPGSIASRRQGPVTKGQRMAGRMGGGRVTVKNLQIVDVDVEKRVLAIKGAIPGARGALILVVSRDGKNLWQG